MVNGEVKQLPKVFNSEEELVEFLKEVVNKALKDPDYASKFNGGGKVVLTVDLNWNKCRRNRRGRISVPKSKRLLQLLP
ncbi:hypothetical protein [Thermococcus gammatolerans]|nr:hypothetical protein [Thermococcus gammatolerans]